VSHFFQNNLFAFRNVKGEKSAATAMNHCQGSSISSSNTAISRCDMSFVSASEQGKKQNARGLLATLPSSPQESSRYLCCSEPQ
jgi:hypothetical protein